MKKVIKKGEPGYTKYRKKRLLAGSVSGFMLMLLFFVTGYVIYGTPKNLVTIAAVIVVLPTVKIYVQYHMLSWKNNADTEYFERLKKENPSLGIYCELQMTGAEKNYEVMYLAVSKDKDVAAYSHNPATDCAKFEKSVVNFLNYYNWDTKAKMYLDLQEFERHVKSLSEKENGITEEQRREIETIFEKISIMSI